MLRRPEGRPPYNLPEATKIPVDAVRSHRASAGSFFLKNQNTKMVSVPTGRKHYFGEIYQRDEFYEATEAAFEEITVKVPKEYDKYLRHMYGNYMDIPPKEKREQHVVLKYRV